MRARSRRFRGTERGPLRPLPFNGVKQSGERHGYQHPRKDTRPTRDREPDRQRQGGRHARSIARTATASAQIERVMLDKLSGKVAYAVMSFGGFMGIGEDYYPLPWSLLTYNPRLEGYEVNIGEQQLKGAPKYSKHENLGLVRPRARQKVYDYYGVAPFWGS